MQNLLKNCPDRTCHINPLEILSVDLVIQWVYRAGLRFGISNKLRGNAHAAVSWATLCVARAQQSMSSQRRETALSGLDQAQAKTALHALRFCSSKQSGRTHGA